MAVNDERSMNHEMMQGSIDSTYISIAPDRGGIIQHPPVERYSWPTYGQAELHKDPPSMEAHVQQMTQPVEYKTASTRNGRGGDPNGDPRF